jgi:hypothetical protein
MKLPPMQLGRASLLQCMSLELARSVGSPRGINSVAIGGIADIARSTAAPGSDVNDPELTQTGSKSCTAASPNLMLPNPL